MLVGIDVVFDFPSQHEGEKSFLSSHRGFFFTAQAETGLGIDKFWAKHHHSEEASSSFQCVRNKFAQNVFEAEEPLPRAMHDHSYNKKMEWVAHGESRLLHKILLPSFHAGPFHLPFTPLRLLSTGDYCCTVMTGIPWHGQTCKMPICCAVATGALVA